MACPPAPASIIYAVDVPPPRAEIAEAAVDAAVGELEVVVVAPAGPLAPPLCDHAPWAGGADHAACHAVAPYVRRLIARREDFERLGRAYAAHHQPAVG